MNINKGKRIKPRRTLIHGGRGVGKTTFGAMAPGAILVPTEEGCNDIDCESFDLAASFADVMRSLTWLYSEPHSYRAIVVDTLDWLERLIWKEVCEAEGVDSIEKIDGGYGKGYAAVLKPWINQFLAGLTGLRNDRGMEVILVAHSRIVKFDDPTTQSYDRYEPDLHKLASAKVQEWCDEVLFATHKVHAVKSGESFGKEEHKGVGTGERILRTTERPAYAAKNRLSLPDELPFDYRIYAEHVAAALSQKPVEAPAQ